MMDLFNHLLLGFNVALSAMNLLYCFYGVIIGTLIGVLPGVGPLATVAVLLPITYHLPPVSALIMLAGIYYGSQYGGSTTAILVNLPGETSSAVICLDGHAMARQGRAGPALCMSALGSFFAGCVSTAVIVLFAPPLAEVAFKFGPTEFFSLVVLGLVAAVILARGSVLKALGMVLLGLLLGTVGTDIYTGTLRFTFGIAALSDGVSLASVAMGLFAIGEVVSSLETKEKREISTYSFRSLFPSRADLKASFGPVVRGTALGSFLGVLPGAGHVISAFGSYALEKRLARDPSRFGKGAIEGVAGPESANNAAAQTSFIPLLTLGIPPNAVIAIMLGAMIIHGITPGPQVMVQQPDLFWGMIVSMWIGNSMLLFFNLPLVGIWVSLLRVPYRLLYPAILTFCAIGVYSINRNIFDVMVLVIFGLLGYVFYKLECEPAPLLLGFILGPMMEEYLRRALLLSRGDPTVFITQPISLGLLLAAAVLFLLVIVPTARRKREDTFQE